MNTTPMKHLMDVKIDYAFRQLFENEKARQLTITFLNELLHRTGSHEISNITF